MLFVFDLSLFDEPWLSRVWITKKNPTRWVTGDAHGNRHFQTVEELDRNFVRGDFGQTILLRHIGGVLRLGPYLRELIVDDLRRMIEGVDVYAQTVGALRASAWQGGLGDISVTRRTCKQPCTCSVQYREAFEKAMPTGDSTLHQFFFLEG